MSSTYQDVSVLNTLIATLEDSVEGYEKSAADVHNADFADRFRNRAGERRRAVVQLQAAVSAAGGDPRESGSIAGDAHRAFMSLREAVSSNDDKAIISEVERGEDYLKAKYEAVLNRSDLSPAALAAVRETWETVRQGHDEMSALKHSLQS